MTNALILAGTRPGGDVLADKLGVAHKALIEIDGEPILQRVIRALQSAGMNRVLVSCDESPVALLASKLGAEVIAPRRGPSASVAAAFEAIGAPLVVTTSDHALLQADWIRELIMGTPHEADLSIMLAERAAVQKAIPGSRRTYLRFADGNWSGCNLFFLQSPNAARALATWSMVEAHRKRPWRIAAKLGVRTLLGMALGKLTLAEGLSRLGRRIGVNAAMVSASDGLAAVDVDKVGDLEAVEQVLARRHY